MTAENERDEQTRSTADNTPNTGESDVEPATADKAPVPERARESARPERGSQGPADPPRRRVSLTAVLALLLALLACSAVGWRWWQDWQDARTVTDAPDWDARIEQEVGQVRSELADMGQSLNRTLTESLGDRRTELDRLADAVQRLDAQVDASDESAERLAAGLQQQLRALERRFEVAEKTVNQLASLNRNTEDELRLAEAEFLMRLAAERLALFGDPAGALVALRLAGDHLRAVEDPLYTRAREALSREIQKLEAVEMPDRATISGRLLQLAEMSGAWPLDERRTVQHSGNWLEAEPDDPGWLARTREVLSELVVVHRDTGEATVMLTLEEQQLLRENVRLQLQVAQLAAVRGEMQLYQASLAAVQGWLEDYFETEATTVRQAMAAVSELREVNVAPELPELGAALRELRGLRSSAEMSEATP